MCRLAPNAGRLGVRQPLVRFTPIGCTTRGHGETIQMTTILTLCLSAGLALGLTANVFRLLALSIALAPIYLLTSIRSGSPHPVVTTLACLLTLQIGYAAGLILVAQSHRWNSSLERKSFALDVADDGLDRRRPGLLTRLAFKQGEESLRQYTDVERQRPIVDVPELRSWPFAPSRRTRVFRRASLQSARRPSTQV